MAEKAKKDAKQKNTQEIYASIREMILNREILPGDKINQITVAKILNTSRTPVVNALHRLESEGLVDSQRNTGFFVHRLSIQELLELFELREALDIVIIGNIIRTISDDEITELDAIFLPCADGLEQLDYEEYRRMDMKFHFTLARLCRNRMVKRVNENSQIFARTYTAGLIRSAQETLNEHLAIIEALKERNAEKAELAMRKHISITTEVIRNTVNGMIKMGLDPETINVDETPLYKETLID